MGTVSRMSEPQPDAKPDTDPDPFFDDPRKFERKVRQCLMCGESFTSEWAGERVCRHCKSTSAWRTG